MANKKIWVGILFEFIAIIAVIGFSMTSCSGGGGKSFNSAEALKKYLDSQPANSPDKPIKVTMNANDKMIEDISEAIRTSNKYVSLNFSGNTLTEIPPAGFGEWALGTRCNTLVSVTIPASVTNIWAFAFAECENLTRVTFQGTIDKNNFFANAFEGDLYFQYFTGGIGTYIRPNNNSSRWMKLVD